MSTIANNENEVIISRIRKLMNYARDGSASEAEVENALGKARALMDKFNIDEQSVLVNDEAARKSAFESILTQEAYSRAGGLDIFYRHLASVAAIISDCKTYTSKVHRTKGGEYKMYEIVCFYGLPRDVAVGIALYKELMSTMRAMVQFRWPEKGEWRKHYRGYCHGFVERLFQRAQRIKDRGVAQAGTTAIVLAKDVILKKFKNEKLNLVPARQSRTRVSDWVGYNAGTQDGSRVELGTNSITQDNKNQRRLS